MSNADLTVHELNSLGDPRRLMDREWAPCRYNCPVHADVRAYVELIGLGRFGPAIDVIRESLPFAAICGRICHHPCEANCRRNDVDKPVAIREVKRFVAELRKAAGSTVRKAARQDKARVAIVGAGPAGMSAALDLARLGYRPTVFEKFSRAGGIPATAIPAYRLPREVIQIDIDWICAHGVELKTGVAIGKDKTLADLRKEGYAAIVLAAGLSKSRMLPLPGADHPQVYPVLDFLGQLAFDKKPPVGGSVLVIGGGNVAVDAARSALRLGAKTVQLMCLEDEKEMPAWSWEQDEARDEGVGVLYRRGPVEVVVKGGRIVGLKARKVTRVFDENRRFSPQYDDKDVIDVPCETVIVAIGQMVDPGFLAGSADVTLDDRGRLVFNPATHQTSAADVFACGEVVTAPGSAVEACAHGQRAAKAVHQYLSGQGVQLNDALPPSIDKIPAATAEKVYKTQRVAVPVEPPMARKTHFREMDHCLSTDAAVTESRRCMGCGGGAEVIVDKCAACLTCLRVCPFDIPKVTDVARIDSALCQACGMCAADCPANAIVIKSSPKGDLAARTAEALAALGGGKKIVAFLSGFHAPASAWSGSLEDAVPRLAEVYLPSMARLGSGDILKAFELGADAVFVVACQIGADRYPNATQRVRQRTAYAKDLLKQVGFAENCVQMFELADQGRAAIRQAMADAAEKLATASR